MINSVKTKILAVSIFPLIVALGFILNTVIEKYHISDEMEQQKEINQYISLSSALLHEIQKERGTSGVFLGSNGTKFKDEMLAQRSKTDTKLNELNQYITNFTISDFGKESDNKLKSSNEKLSTISSLRDKINNVSIKAGDSLNAYSDINKNLISAISSVSRFGTTTRIILSRLTFLNFVQGKELAGIERALMAGTFAKDIFVGDGYTKFLNLINEQEMYFSMFRDSASNDEIKELDAFATQQEVIETQRLRNIALEKGRKRENSKLLAELSGLLGYGGAIHLFKNYILRNNDKFFTRYIKKRAEIQTIINDLRNLDSFKAEDEQFLQTIEMTINKYSDAILAAKKMFKNGKNSHEIDTVIKINDSPAIKAINTLVEASIPGNFGVEGAYWFKTITAKINLMRDLEISIIEKNRVLGLELTTNANTLLTGLIVLAFIISSLVITSVFFISKGIINSLNSAVIFAENISNGDIRGQIENQPNDEIGALSNALNEMANNLKIMIQDVDTTSSQLNDSATNMLQISSVTSSGVQRQQNELQQISSAMTEMNSTVSQVSDNTAQAKSATNDANKEADDGKSIVNTTTQSINALASELEQVSNAVKLLETETTNIGSVLVVIQGIAEQTNLLALNAAIEAARAGEQGRGFAVVADEVRTLAGRTQQATIEIQQMNENLQNGATAAVTAMENGRAQAIESVEQAGKANDSLDSIRSAFGTVTQMNDQIAISSDQQLSVTQKIDNNINHIHIIADETADGAKQTENACSELSKLADNLQQTLSKFSV